MNKFYVDNKLKEHPELLAIYGDKFSSFRQFCILTMDKFGWQSIESIRVEFDEETFYGLRFKRMYETNVKKWKNISQKVFERDAYTCFYCGQVGGVLEVDHVIPFSKGGADTMDNLVTACRKCNRQKRDKTYAEFIKWRERDA